MKLKVCGMTDFEQLQTLNKLGVDFAGLIFYKSSKRFVDDKLEGLKPEIEKLEIKRVGVFVNADLQDIKDAVEGYGLSYVQLHGDETAEFCKKLREFVPVIKAIRISEETNLDNEIKKFEDACDYFLFDTDSKQYGGSGKKFNWDKLSLANISKPFFLSGGIGLEDAQEVKSFNHPMLYAIDVNSKFETSPGVKDLKQVESFMQNVK